MKKPKLAKLELRILEALWAQGRATMREIQETFPEPHYCLPLPSPTRCTGWKPNAPYDE